MNYSVSYQIDCSIRKSAQAPLDDLALIQLFDSFAVSQYFPLVFNNLLSIISLVGMETYRSSRLTCKISINSQVEFPINPGLARVSYMISSLPQRGTLSRLWVLED
jgi:hypothetical protein